MEQMKWIDERVKPFNQFYLGSCFTEAYLPAFCALGGDAEAFLLNNVVYFEFSEEKLKIRSSYLYETEELEKQYGLASKFYIDKLDDVVETVLSSLKQQKLCICRADNPIAYDVEKEKNAVGSGEGVIHWLLIYGYDMEKQVFHVLEHRTNFSALYQHMVISFEELRRTYYASFHLGEEERSFFKIWEENVMNAGKNIVQPLKKKQRLQERMKWLGEHAGDSIEQLTSFYDNLEQKELKVNVTRLLKYINDIIMYFRQESYLFPEAEELLEEIVKYNNLLRSYALKALTGKPIRQERYIQYCVKIKDKIQEYKEFYHEILSN